MKLNILKKFPHDFENYEVSGLHQLLGGPTLIDLEGSTTKTIFISILLHGNEHSGFQIIKKLASHLASNKNLSRHGLLIFIGNTKAAANNKRHLENQVDYNRIWEINDTLESKLANDVLNYAKTKQLIYNIDIHNNTGKNPYYGCINQTTTKFLELANYFFSPIVYFTEPHEVQSMAFSKVCPSVTLEAGTSNDPIAINIIFGRIVHLIEANFLLPKIDKLKIQLYHTIASIKIHPSSNIDFEYQLNEQTNLSFKTDLEKNNFQIIKAGESFGYITNEKFLWVQEGTNKKMFSDFFEIIQNKLILKRDIIPAMLSKNVEVIKDDCLGYIMEKYPL